MSGSGSTMSFKAGGDGSDSLSARMQKARLSNPPVRRGDIVHDFTRTRPDTLQTKCGTSGRPIALKANFVKMQKVRVSFPLLFAWLFHQQLGGARLG